MNTASPTNAPGAAAPVANPPRDSAAPQCDSTTVTRRDMLKTTAAIGGGLILGFTLGPRGRLKAALAAGGAAADPVALNAFLRIAPDESITVIYNHGEMGQGISTTLPMLLGDELDADWSKIRIEAAPVVNGDSRDLGGMQFVAGSSTTRSEYERFRRTGATARAMLVAAAAKQWSVDPATCSTGSGFVLHQASGRKASYGSLADAASKLDAPKDVKLKEEKDFKFIGKPMKRIDAAVKSNGKAMFGIDVSLPGMLVAVVARPPVFGGKLVKFDDAAAKAVPGVKHVVQISRGVGVVATGFWAAKLGCDALKIEWDDGPLATRDSQRQRDEYAGLAAGEGLVAKKVGDVDAVFPSASTKIEAVYEVPYLAHAPMEPLNALVDIREDGCDVYAGTQNPGGDQGTAAEVSGLPPEKVQVHSMFMGGGFGRRAALDGHIVREAAELSKAVKAPVKVIWTREDDTRGGYYRPAVRHSLAGGLDDKNAPIAWKHRIVCQSFGGGKAKRADGAAVEGAADMPYDIPNRLIDWTQAPGGVPTHWWRSVGHSHTAFAVESFIDELAHAAKVDPLVFRRTLLAKDQRRLACLEFAAEKAGWGTPVPAGRGRGLAVHYSFGTCVAHVAEVAVAKDGGVRVHKVTTVVDCGPAVNPAGIAMQIEGAIVFGLSAALHGQITFAQGRVVESNFHDYPMLRIHEMPEIEVHILPSKARMGGIGEPGVPPIAPAVTNAIFAATGKRIRRLPLRLAQEELKSA